MTYKVFLVEDEIVTREGIRDTVDWAAAGYEFCGEAPDGEIALPLIRERRPETVITDVKMPFMDGLQLCRILKETLLTAQKLADEIREEARKEAGLIVREAEVKASQLLDQAARKSGELEGVILALRVERDAFAARIRAAVEQHLRLLDMHRNEEQVEDRLRFMKKPAEPSSS